MKQAPIPEQAMEAPDREQTKEAPDVDQPFGVSLKAVALCTSSPTVTRSTTARKGRYRPTH